MRTNFSKVYFRLSIVIIPLLSFISVFAVDAPTKLMSPTGTASDSTITVLWNKPEDYKAVNSYNIYVDGKVAGNTSKTNYTAKKLEADKPYKISVIAVSDGKEVSVKSNEIEVKTMPKGKVFNILSYGAVGDSLTLNTKYIQKAIDACTPGGTVYIPAGIYLSGALYLKSNMSLYLAKGAVLKGSSNMNDYYPLIPSRFEGWEVMSFASLITAGKLDKNGGTDVVNLSIRGEGTIRGGGYEMAKEMIAKEGLRSRNRLICLQNCENVDIQGVTLDNSPCWTIHYTYCKNITCRDLIIFNDSGNGDGIDPDSSIDSYIFNCWFSTGDDCIAIKSGKNPEGNIIAKPTIGVRVTDCEFVRGHSLAIGSELSGGVKDVYVRDCKIGALDEGVRIKTNKFRGGYVENVTVKDCDLLKVKITTIYNPNNDGEPAKETTRLTNILFENINMTEAPIKKPVISVDGFENPEYYFKNLIFRNIKMPENSKVMIKYCENVSFENITTISGQKPSFDVTNSLNIKY